MAKKPNPHPHVAWRDGRPRFVPGKAARALGFTGTDLRHPAESDIKPAELPIGADNGGRWFTRGEAVDWSEAFRTQLEAARDARARAEAAAAKGRARPARPRHTYPLSQLFHDWFLSPKFTAGLHASVGREQASETPAGRKRGGAPGKRVNQKVYAPNTVRDFRQKARVIESHDPDLWASEVDALDTAICYGLYEDLWRARGLSTARGVMATLSTAISWGLRRGKFRRMKSNPALKLGMQLPEPRVRFATRSEFHALVAAADHCGRDEMGDMFYLGIWSGQRQADRLALVDRGLINNRRGFRQEKTGAVVAIMQAPELEARLSASQERRRRANVASRHVILDETTWQPFNVWTYRRLFIEIRDSAVAGIVDVEKTREARAAHEAANETELRNTPPPVVYAIEPCPSLADFWDMDFRDTSVTWMALAGATIPEIVSVTGHSAETATQILKHYLARHPEMADSAIAKMIAWYDAGGETEMGY